MSAVRSRQHPPVTRAPSQGEWSSPWLGDDPQSSCGREPESPPSPPPGAQVTVVTVTCAELDLVGSATDVAVTVPVPAVMPAVNIPFWSMLPIDPFVDQVTPCVVLVTCAVKRVFAPTFN